MTIFQITSVLVTVVVSVVNGSGGDSDLHWKRHYDSAKRVAQATRKPLVVVIENAKASEKIDVSKLGDEDRKLLSKGKFELCRVDATTDYGKKVAAAFGAKQFPYTVVTDKESKLIVFRKPGQMSQRDWRFALAKSNKAKTAKPVVSSSPASGTVQRQVINGVVYEQTVADHATPAYPAIQAAPAYQQPAPAYSAPVYNTFPQGSFSTPYAAPCNT